MKWRVDKVIFNIRFYTKAGISITLLSIFLLLCGNVELNAGPNKKRNSWFNFSICHWNLNSLTAYNFDEVNILEAYSTVNNLFLIFS